MSNSPSAPIYRISLAFLGLVLFGWGCIADNSVRLRSMAQSAADMPSLTSSAYIDEGSGGASVFLTDLPPHALDAGTDIKTLSGRIVQIRMFLTPAAGSTPIGRSACTATVRHIILANGSIGVYSGGGFMWPSGTLGGPRFGGTVERATMRLTGSTGNFSDRLGASTFDATFNARRDAALANRIGARVDDVLVLIGEAPAPNAGR